MKRISCPFCHGKGHVTVFDGLAALAKKYPQLPVREMAARGWFEGVPNSPEDETDEDEKVWDSAFLKFWGVNSHADVAVILAQGIGNAVVCSGDRP